MLKLFIKTMTALSLGLAITLMAYGDSDLSKEEKSIFRPAPVAMGHQYKLALAHKEVKLNRPDGAKLHGILFKSKKIHKDPKQLIVFYKGRSGNVQHTPKYAKLFLPQGYDVLIFDYRGSGKSRGRLKESALLDDAVAWYDYGVKHYKKANVHVVGYSLGSAMASHVAPTRLLNRLTLIAPFKSAIDIAREDYSKLIANEIFMDYPFRSDKKLQKAARTYVTIFHGTEDDVIPFKSGQELYQGIAAHARFIPVKGANHTDLFTNKRVLAELSKIYDGKPVRNKKKKTLKKKKMEGAVKKVIE